MTWSVWWSSLRPSDERLHFILHYIAQVKLLSKKLVPDPTLKFSIDNLPVNRPYKFSLTRDFMTMRRVGVEQQWVSSEKRAARAQRGQRTVEAEEASYLTNVAKVREETAVAWINVLYAQRTVDLLSALENETSQDLTTSQAALRGAKAGGSDVVQAQLTLSQAKDRSRKGEQALRSARTALARWIAGPVELVADALECTSGHHSCGRGNYRRYKRAQP